MSVVSGTDQMDSASSTPDSTQPGFVATHPLVVLIVLAAIGIGAFLMVKHKAASKPAANSATDANGNPISGTTGLSTDANGNPIVYMAGADTFLNNWSATNSFDNVTQNSGVNSGNTGDLTVNSGALSGNSGSLTNAGAVSSAYGPVTSGAANAPGFTATSPIPGSTGLGNNIMLPDVNSTGVPSGAATTPANTGVIPTTPGATGAATTGNQLPGFDPGPVHLGWQPGNTGTINSGSLSGNTGTITNTGTVITDNEPGSLVPPSPPAPTPVPAQPAGTHPWIHPHRVKKGETIESIASEFKTTWQEVYQHNQLIIDAGAKGKGSPPWKHLRRGEVLIVPNTKVLSVLP